jgi:hypothetical protein
MVLLILFFNFNQCTPTWGCLKRRQLECIITEVLGCGIRVLARSSISTSPKETDENHERALSTVDIPVRIRI